MPEHDDQITKALSEVTNALQVAAPLAGRLRVITAQSADDAVRLDGAIDRAVRALRTLQPGDGREKGRT